MPISVGKARQHVSEWSERLAQYPAMAKWPQHLFHTCQLEVAAAILSMGKIVCRNDVPALICDVANQGALWNNPASHEYVRLYFRPRNPFHLKTEGIKARGDQYRVDPHMSIPIVFAFDLEQVLTTPDSGFVPGNFARSASSPLTGNSKFDEMEFGLIYHDSAPPSNRKTEIHNWRMSEVVVKKSLSLSSLSYIICRTTHDERSLRYALGTRPAPKIIVEQRGSSFFRWAIFIDEIYWLDNQMHMKFHGPTGFSKETYSVSVTCMEGNSIRHDQFDLKPGKYRFQSIPASKNAVWKIDIEGCLAYFAPVPSMSGLVV